jgi:8-amino-7-oxononanoate synthase
MEPAYILETAPGPRVVIGGRPYLYFAGTGYLGLQSHPDLIRAGCEALQKYGTHSATVRTGYGNQPPTLEAEATAAEFFGSEAAFYFASGYAGMAALLPAIEERFDAVFVERLSHYAVHDALKLSGLPVHPFAHRDAADLAVQVRQHLKPGGRPLVVTDGVFPVSGRIAPVDHYHALLAHFPGSGIALDDAHAVGVLGEHGRGTFEHFKLDSGVNRDGADDGASGPVSLFLCATLSKAIGGQGGIIPGSRRFIDRVTGGCGYYFAASAPAAPIAAATAVGLRLAAEPTLRHQLHANVALAKSLFREIGLEIDATLVPIIGLSLGDAANMRRIHRRLLERGIAIAYTPSYSGVGLEGALRIALFATHTAEMILQLAAELRAAI